MNFIWKIFHGKIDEEVHKQFVRFGRGEYGRRALLSLWKTPNSIKVKGSFEFANDFVSFVAGLGGGKVSGDILSRIDILDFFSKKGVEIESKKKAGVYVNSLSPQNLSADTIRDLAESSYYSLLNVEGEGFTLKIKKKLPKPGKDEAKIDDKFCQMELDPKYYGKVKEDFFWDIPECKKASASHKYIISEIIMPPGEKDFAKIREMARRKGRIIRILDCDGRELKSEKNFEA